MSEGPPEGMLWAGPADGHELIVESRHVASTFVSDSSHTDCFAVDKQDDAEVLLPVEAVDAVDWKVSRETPPISHPDASGGYRYSGDRPSQAAVERCEQVEKFEKVVDPVEASGQLITANLARIADFSAVSCELDVI